MNSGSLKNSARFAGAVYFVWILTGLFAMYYVPSQINIQSDAVTAAQDILSKEFLFRTSIVIDLISSAIWVFLVLVLYRLLKPVDGRQAKLMVALVIVQIPPVFIMEAFNVTSLMTLKGEILKTFALSQRQELAMLFLKINEYGVLGLELFWGLWLIPLAILVYKSRFLPRFLGIWLFIDGLALIILCFTGLLLPQYHDIVFKVAFPAMLGEFALMLWLLIRGANMQPTNNTPVPS